MVAPNQNQDRDQNQPTEARKSQPPSPGNLKKSPEKTSEIGRKSGEQSQSGRH